MSHKRRTEAAGQARVRRQPVRPAADGAAQHPLLRLQRQLGNRQVARMLAQREDMDEIQTTRVQREDMDEIQTTRVQREDMDEIQASPEVGLEGGPVSQQTAQRIQSMRGGGAPLSDGMRSNMEQALDTDFSDVRVHSGGESSSINRAISAKAFTTGSDIFLGDGASASDSHLMAHELTHVVQQRSMSSSGPMSVGPADDHYEREAEATASSLPSSPAPAPAQREADETGE
jgi:hypothetical protein